MKEKPVFSSPVVTEHDVEISKERDYYVVQHNDLVRDLYFDFKGHKEMALTMTEEKILAYLISKIKPGTKVFEPITFDVKTFCEVCGIATGNTNNPYPFIKDSIKKLADKSSWLAGKDGKESLVRYIADADITPGSGKIDIVLHGKLAPYLLSLSGHYFQFSYRNIIAMKSRYGIQLYKLLKSYVYNCPRIKWNVDDLKHYLDATKYARFSNFNQKVLAPAIEDINDYSDLEIVKTEFVKEGKTITHVIFELHDLENPKNNRDKAEKTKRIINATAKIDPDQIVIPEVVEGGEYP